MCSCVNEWICINSSISKPRPPYLAQWAASYWWQYRHGLQRYTGTMPSRLDSHYWCKAWIDLHWPLSCTSRHWQGSFCYPSASSSWALEHPRTPPQVEPFHAPLPSRSSCVEGNVVWTLCSDLCKQRSVLTSPPMLKLHHIAANIMVWGATPKQLWGFIP